jgi:DNA-binding transcriptional LysR family regulator
MFDLNASHIFVCVVEEQGFTAAATRLGMPKQTISRRITELEETLGVRLLERSTRKIRMTRVGELFFAHAQQIVHTAELAEESVFQTKLEPSGKLHLATSHLLLELTLQHIILDYMKRYPKVTVKVTLADTGLDLYNQNVDIGFVIGPLKDSSVVAKRLGNTWLNCLASPLYLETHGQPSTPTDLKTMPIITYTEPLYGQSNLWQFEQLDMDDTVLNTQDVTLDGCLHTPSFWLAREAAIQGLGVVKLPSSILHHEIKTNQLVDVFEDWRIVESALFAIFPSRKMLSLPVRSFLELLEQAMPNTQIQRPDIEEIQDSTIRIHPPKIDY